MKKAFTLVELAIVIVIIGILVTGVIAGSNLINQAKIKSDFASLQQYRAAIETFRAKYRQLPGDFSHATKFWADCTDRGDLYGQGNPGDIAHCNGDGDGQWTMPEGVYVWEHLSRAGLMAGDYRAAPLVNGSFSPILKSTSQNVYPLTSRSGGDFASENFYNIPLGKNMFVFFYNRNDDFTGDWPNQPPTTAATVYAFDEKFDDGNASTGNIRAFYIADVDTDNPAVLCSGADGKYRISTEQPHLCIFSMIY